MKDAPQPTPEHEAELRRVLGKRLRAVRGSWRLGLQDVATWMGLTTTRIADIECGRARALFTEVFELSRLYWVSLDYLAGRTSDPIPWEGRLVDRRAFGFLLGPLRAAATDGALSVVTNGLAVREAGDQVVEKLEDAVLTGKRLRNPRMWAFRIGQHAARRLLKGQKKVSFEGEPWKVQLAAAEELDGDGDSSCWLVDRAELQQALAARRELLSEDQWEVVQAVPEHDSLKAVADAVGKKVSNVRKLFKRALEKLRGGGLNEMGHTLEAPFLRSARRMSFGVGIARRGVGEGFSVSMRSAQEAKQQRVRAA